MRNEIQSDAGALARCAVVIPVWRPEAATLALVRALLAAGFGGLVLVDDGSGVHYAAMFDEVTLLPGVAFMEHEVNRGKGAALRTGFAYALEFLPSFDVVVTADADGQHTAKDVARVALRAAQGNAVVLGVRGFDGAIPLRSRFGNAVSRVAFRAVTGRNVSDTQTGLRAFPRTLLPALMAIDGDRYEYEMAVLVTVSRREPPVEVGIRTVYLEGNRSSRFRPVRDSLRIYGVLLRSVFRR